MKANYQLLIISCQSPDGTEYHKSFEGLKISPKLPNCLICMLTKLFYFSDNFSGYCCSFINISPDISVTRQKVCSVLGTGGRAPCAYFCIPLCLFSAQFHLCPALQVTPSFLQASVPTVCMVQTQGDHTGRAV